MGWPSTLSSQDARVDLNAYNVTTVQFVFAAVQVIVLNCYLMYLGFVSCYLFIGPEKCQFSVH